MFFLSKLKNRISSWNVKLKKKSLNFRINDVILGENLPKPEERTQQEQIVMYIYISQISLFSAEIELLEWCAITFYQCSNERERKLKILC